MRYTRLGNTGMQISEVVLGCMSFGTPDQGGHAWTLDEEASRPLIRRALEKGITTFDTADVYSDGSSEEIVGRALADFAQRDDVVIATKVHGRMGATPNRGGLSRVHIMSAIDDSLRRLGVDTIDLYQIHRWDPETPIEETMTALHDLVRSGKVRYIGASSMWAWQFAKAQRAAAVNGLTPFVSMQDQYNLLQREEEREMHPLCLDEKIGVLPWSPLARGRLTRDWDAETERTGKDLFGARLYTSDDSSNRAIVDAVAGIAAERGISRAQVALAWVRQQSAVTAPIVGATKANHIDDAVASLDIELSGPELERLTAPYTPRNPEGF
ncbi:aldo/keto reductase [Agreia sp. VKM Ac-1783]|uniref:aldo/keto reductase n=1 Tax=Agreia sp. VKM Ac-1783 TaxID=1938889 RepID=UPI000A2ACAA8|nr:aldo/keto reductase [Agreia sp. VKM Ac-1783]SMQ71332.1 Predicted oxidoreductase [Agreia sp. VKM Ac-1783]